MFAKLSSKPDPAHPFAHFLGLPRKKTFTPIPIGGAGGKTAQDGRAPETPKPAGKTSSRGAEAERAPFNFAHLAPTNDRLGLHRAADANRAAHAADTAEQAADNADRAMALRIVAAGKARRGEATPSTGRAPAAPPVAQSERADRDLAMMIVAAGKKRRGEA
ncbi:MULTISPECIES: hypothetical protein [Acidiphilium]|uniref:Uncharacterized protein n=1 Tax=Acidiphilium rubrum TaxID=526 RepID=A0A8G2CJ84_ACIRU|nr:MULTISPECIES: hypothetical protein [Acidiphilium]SIQ46513.1 hypothetical protein SAMN05421828_10528 [Acidiphilium rubrum]